MSKAFDFMVNLRSETVRDSFIASLKPRGYLISPAYFSASIRKELGSLVEKKHKIFLDNGNFSIIGDLKAEYKKRVLQALAPFSKKEKGNGSTTPEDLAAVTGLAWEISKRAHALVPSDKAILARQMTVEATHLIGCEDVTMACWLAMNLEPEILDIADSEYRKLNARVADRAVEILRTLPSKTAKNYYPVASAVSYDTAFDAGREFAQAGIKKVAMGFGSYTADGNYCQSVVIRGKEYELPAFVPARYVRMVLVARGFWQGYHAVARRSPEAFHFLGLGTPLFMALCSLVTKNTSEITFDATSPIADAVEGTLYVSKPAYLKIQTRKAALRLATVDKATWNCPCPFCTDFMKKYPFNYDLGLRNWRKARKETPEDKDLRPGGLLYDAYPFLSEPNKGQLKTAVSFARMGHNHWVIAEVTNKLTSEAKKGTLTRHVSKIVKNYIGNTKTDQLAKAVRLSHDIASAKDIKDFTSALARSSG